MELRTLLLSFLAYAIYPAWLVAGAFDYFSHRRTHIADTSGRTESLLHIAQFVTIAIIYFGAVCLHPTLPMIAILGVAAVLHLVLSYVDVAYTQGKRFISPLEQHIHGFLDVLPIVAVCLLALIGWNESADAMGFESQLDQMSAAQIALLLGSFTLLAGVPVLEEYFRTATRSRGTHRDVHVATMIR